MHAASLSFPAMALHVGKSATEVQQKKCVDVLKTDSGKETTAKVGHGSKEEVNKKLYLLIRKIDS